MAAELSRVRSSVLAGGNICRWIDRLGTWIGISKQHVLGFYAFRPRFLLRALLSIF